MDVPLFLEYGSKSLAGTQKHIKELTYGHRGLFASSLMFYPNLRFFEVINHGFPDRQDMRSKVNENQLGFFWPSETHRLNIR